MNQLEFSCSTSIILSTASKNFASPTASLHLFLLTPQFTSLITWILHYSQIPHTIVILWAKCFILIIPTLTLSMHLALLLILLKLHIKAHIKSPIHTKCYLKGTMHFAILYWQREEINPSSYTDSDFRGNPKQQKSLSKYLFNIGIASVSWQSKLQDEIVESSFEAEYRTRFDALKKAL